MLRTVLILALLLPLAGCLDRPDAPPAAPERSVRFHLRLHDAADGSLLYSTWPGENGTAQAHANGTLRQPFVVNASREVPRVLDPLASFWWAAQPGTTVVVDGVTLAQADPTTQTVARRVEVDLAGELTPEQAVRILGNRTSTRVLYGGAIPMTLAASGDDRLAYSFDLPAETRFPVERTEGLHVRATPDTARGRAAFALELEGDRFTTLGCRLLEGRVFDPGYYILLHEDAASYTFAHYRERTELELQGRTVRAELTIMKDGSEVNE